MFGNLEYCSTHQSKNDTVNINLVIQKFITGINTSCLFQLKLVQISVQNPISVKSVLFLGKKQKGQWWFQSQM